MALSVLFDGTTLAEGLSAESGDWTGTDGVSTEVFQQGVSSEGWLVSKSANETAIYDYYTANGNVAADMSASDTHLYIHMRCDIAPFIDYLYFQITDGSGNYKKWLIVDHTVAIEWYGEWKTFIIDINSTPNTSSGTLVYTDIRNVQINVDNSNSGNIRSIENTYIDVMRFGTGVIAYESTSAPFDFADIEAIANNAANKFGVIEALGGVLFLRGAVTCGDSVGTNYGNLVSSDETLVYLDPSVSGEAISAGLFKLAFVGNATNPSVASIGIKVGTGDTMTGRNGTTVKGQSSSVKCAVSADANVSLDLYAATFQLLGGLISLGNLDSGDDLASCSFDGCDQVDTGSGVVRNTNFLNTVAPVTSGALLWSEGQTDTKNCLLVNNIAAVEVPSLTADMTFVGMEFSSNTSDVRYEGTTDWNLNWSEAPSAPTILNASTGTLTAVNTVTLEINGVSASTTRCAIYAASGGPETVGTELMNELSDATGTAQQDYAYVSVQPVVVRAREGGYLPYESNAVIDANGLTVTAVWLTDPNFTAP